MPELPEVQTVVDDLIAAGLTGKRILSAAVYWKKTIATSVPGKFCQSIHGRKILRIYRRAKYIVMDLDRGLFLAIHLRMSGRLKLRSGPIAADKHIHVVLNLGDGRSLQFHDTRKFGRFYLVGSLDRLFASLGPEPLAKAFDVCAFAKRMAGKRRQIKPLLLDQSFLAGLGNIYVDESLWTAGIHPLRRADTLQQQEIKDLHRAIRKVLKKGLRNAGTTLGWGLNNFSSIGETRGRNASELHVFRRTGSPCARCRGPIERIMVGQRATHYCPKCQPLPSAR
jgi:formamidopyrimidine-DNA glycosylase